MKTELEAEDIQAIVKEVIRQVKPLLKNDKTEDVIFDVSGLAEYLKVNDSWIYTQVSLKAIPYFKSGKYLRFKQSAIDKWIDSQTVRTIPQ
jgi:excisionase family DNA binding protein